MQSGPGWSLLLASCRFPFFGPQFPPLSNGSITIISAPSGYGQDELTQSGKCTFSERQPSLSFLQTGPLFLEAPPMFLVSEMLSEHVCALYSSSCF